MDAVAALRLQGEACGRLGSAMYADLLPRLADDLVAGGPTASVVAGHEDDPGPSALGLRLLGSVHRLVLERRAGGLATFYPSVGGTWEPGAGWPALRSLLADAPEDVREWLDRAPQTNEVGRAAALYGGLLQLDARLPVRLREIGSSGGLNLRADRFGYGDAVGCVFGRDGGLVLDGAWAGRALDPWPDLRVPDRGGCDLHPVDPTTTQGRLALTAYVWPDQRDRLERLRAALRIAAQVPAPVRACGAATYVEDLDLAEGTTTVLWHSVMWQYLDGAEQHAVEDRLAALGETAGPTRRLAHLRLEPSRRAPDAPHEFLVRLREWPGGEDRVLGHAAPHGLPTTWE